MPAYTVEYLLNGDDQIIRNYQNAVALWRDILQRPQANSVDGLAQILTNEQLIFEDQCGGRWVGQEIMVVVGIAQFYSTAAGFDENRRAAERVRDAFEASFCSIEVKAHAREVAEMYRL